MKWIRIVLPALLLLFSTPSIAGAEDEIKATVKKWNDFHNGGDENQFNDILAPGVLFYGRQTAMETVIKNKKKLLAIGFSQEIISEIDITYFSSGTIKCDFTKRTFANKVTKEHLCYLLLEKKGGKYLITGESDNLTDQKRNVKLNLGSTVMSPSTRNLILVGISSLVLCAWYLWKRARKRKAEEEVEQQLVYNSYTATPQPISIQPAIDGSKLKEEVKAAIKEEFSNFKKEEKVEASKGDEFEKYVITRFDKEYFKLMEWRSDKIHEGVYPMSSHDPDMVWKFDHRFASSALFAVECKYRSDYWKEYIEIAEYRQLDNYRRFSKEQRMPVFIVLGVGGKASNPEEMFVIPLDELRNNKISRHNLSRFRKHKANGTFFYNSQREELS